MAQTTRPSAKRAKKEVQHLRQMRERDADPMLKRLREILEHPTEGGVGYRPMTVKSYLWHAKAYQDFCDDKKIIPSEATTEILESYLARISKEVKQNKKSRPYFLQACTSIEILYRTVIRNDLLARAIPRLRKKVSA